jgi:hypothetical protein
MDTYRVARTMQERLALEQLVSVGQAAARKLTQARILLLADERLGEAEAEAEIGSALGPSLRTMERLRQRCVPEGLEAAWDHRPPPPRPAKVQSKGNAAPPWLALACSAPPCGRCPWTVPLLADALVVLGLVDPMSTVTVWQALKKMPSSRGAASRGVSPPRRTQRASGVGRMCCRPLCCLPLHPSPWWASMQHVSHGSARCDRPNGRARVGQPGSMMHRSGQGAATR